MIVSVEIPEELYERASEIARLQSISVGDVVATACAEHVAAWDRIREKAGRGQRAKFLKVLSRVPDVEPEGPDRF